MAGLKTFLKNKNISAVLAFAFVLAAVVSTIALTKASDGTQAAVNGNDSQCQPAYNYLTGSLIDDGSTSGVATGTITNNSTDCTYRVGIASYKMYHVETPHGDPDDRWLYTQELHKTVSFNIAPGQTLGPDKLRVALPDCRAQVDLFEGEAIVPPVYNTPGHYLMDFAFINKPVCVKPTPTPTPTPTSTNRNPNLRVEKTVRNVSVNSSASFVEKVEARKDEQVEFKIEVKNIGDATAHNVMVQDVLPHLLSYASNTVKIDGLTNSGDLFGSGLSLGSLNRNQSKTIVFKTYAQAVSEHKTVTNTAKTWASNTGQDSDTARVELIPVQSVHVELVFSKRAHNITQAKDATTVTAKPGDVIAYTLKAQNNGSVAVNNHEFHDHIDDILQLADLVSYPGATFDANNKILTWSPVTVPAGLAMEKTFTVKVKSSIPTGTDYVMTNAYGNVVNVPVAKRFVAPPAGAGTTASAVLAFITVAGFAGYQMLNKRKQLV